MPTLPGVQSLSIAIRHMEGGRERFIEFVQLAMLNRQPTAEKFWVVYADLSPYERSRASFDDVCMAAGIRPSEFMGAIISTAMEYMADVGNLVAAAAHPSVVSQQIKSASRIGGAHADIAFRDRMAFLQHQQFLPVPKGTTINIAANAAANSQAASAASAEPSVPSFSGNLKALQGTMRAIQAELVEDPPDDE